MSSGGEWDESKHPRVPAGSPAGGEFAGGNIEGQRESLHSMYERMSRPDGGFTYRPMSHFEPKTGYPVSIYPSRSFAKRVNEITMKDVLAFMLHNIDLLKRPGNYLGGWHDPRSHKAFLDVVIVAKTHAEARDLALRHDQKAYFDLANGRSVYVNPRATSGGVAD